jgi:hypothetical protein
MPDEIDPLSAGILGRLDERGLIDRDQHGFEHVGLMAVDNHVDMVFFENTHVNIHRHRRGGAKKDVGNLRGHHGSTPTVGKGRAAALFRNIFIVLIHTDMRAMH